MNYQVGQPQSHNSTSKSRYPYIGVDALKMKAEGLLKGKLLIFSILTSIHLIFHRH
jgi:hypothetical protein